jgi:hypothetical protein
MAEERWAAAPGYEGLYEVSTHGRVKSIKRLHTTGGIMKTHVNKGYEYAHLCKDGKHHNAKVHRLVASAFIPMRENANEVNHIDGDKLNNNVSNLEWVTASENQKHALATGLNRCGINNDLTSKAVDMFSIAGELQKTFPSFMEAERQTGIRRANIQGCCAGRYGFKTAGGYVWKYHLQEVLPE